MPTVLVAPDKFKGTCTAGEVAAALADGIRSARPDVVVHEVPVADGGDGTLDAVLTAGFSRLAVRVSGPTGRPVEAAVAVRDGLAVVELAAASGLGLLPAGRTDPLGATSYGTGEMVRAALDHGCREVVLGVGGSACTDGGAGLLQALGARLYDATGAELPGNGRALADLHSLDLTGLDPRLRDVDLVLASDVDNPLLGPAGAATVYGPQKGASPDEVAVLEDGLRRWASQVGAALAAGAARMVNEAGTGAAGGVGYAALAVLGARRRPGIDMVLELVGFHRAMEGADLVVTGEGSLDEQTLHGKAPLGVAAAARRAKLPVVAVCGRLGLDERRLRGAGMCAAHSLAEVEPDPSRCLADPHPILRVLGARIARTHLPPAGAPA